MEGHKFKELKLVGVTINDHESFLQFLLDLRETFNMHTLTISAVHLSLPQFNALVAFLKDNPTML